MNHPSPSFFEDIPLPEMGRSASGRRWVLRPVDPRAVTMMAQTAGLPMQLARVLCARGVSLDALDAYLKPSLRDSMPDPFVLKDMDKAAEAAADAVLAGKKIGVFGDYDVDGTTAAAIVKRYFDALNLPLEIYLPDRMTEGYGPSIEAFRSLAESGAELVITVDCGAAAEEPISQAAAEGLGIVVLDHHLMTGPAPKGALATVNPNRPDDISGLNNFSAAGVAFMFVVALNRLLRERGFFADRTEPRVMDFLDLAALGLVCDVMDITGLTRTMVAQGLKVLGARSNPGLKALGERAGVKGAPSTYHLGFLLGPRINAAGRIGHARLAFELLTSRDRDRCAVLAEKLHAMNADRQTIEMDVQMAAAQQIETMGLDKDNVIVVTGEGWHSGVIGIVAGRLKERFDKPVIVIGTEGDLGKGSGRSISGVDLGSAVSEAKSSGMLVSGGGHAMAAGLTIEASKIDAFKTHLNSSLAEPCRKAGLNREMRVDGVLSASSVTRSFADLIDQAAPFGPGNAEPQFVLADMRIAGLRRVGENHLSVTLKGPGGEAVRGIAFRAAGEPLGELLENSARVHVAGKIRADDWRGGDAGQIQISDVATAP